MKTILIDTSSNEQIIVGLKIDDKEEIVREKIGRDKAQIVLPTIDKLLKKNNLSLKEIDEIEVNTGPGSFTGLRVGITVANTLGFLLKIPINKKPVGTLAEAVYS